MQYRITLSTPDKTVQVNQRLVDGRAVRVPVKTRAVELEILDACYNALAKQTQHLGEYLQCIRSMARIQGADDSIRFVDFSKSDLENLIIGFDLTRGNRPDSWARCVEFFSQLDAPEQITVKSLT